jgi:predicted amidophosphoribosyltransferase
VTLPRGFSRAASAALDIAFPAACAGCGREGEPLCATCRRALDARLELRGGTPIGLPADLPFPLLQLDWCAPFAGPVRAALLQLKYAGERRLARPLGEAIARRWDRVGVGTDLVVPVPVHAERKRQRGYDQAALIAEVAAGALGLPCVRALERARATVAQFELGRDERSANVSGAFRVRGASRSPANATAARAAAARPDASGTAARAAAAGSGTAGTAVDGRWVLLVDDVVTTGSTLAACAVALEEAGATAVSAITVARER